VDKVSYAHDHGVLADFAARPAQTVPLILLRHSKAVAKSGWKRADAARPLDDSGRSDAKALVDLLVCFAPAPRLISSPAVRCTETLLPLSEATGEQVRVEQSLYIQGQSSRPGAADPGTEITALVREVIASGEPTVICAHRENLPDLQEAALAVLAGHSAHATGAGAPGGAIAELPDEWDEALPTSGFWVLNVAPLPAPPAPEPDLAAPDPAAPEPPDPASAKVPGRRWWQRLRVRASHDVAARPAPGLAGGDVVSAHPTSGNANGSETDEGDVTGSETRGGDGDRARAPVPVGVLISADRYDLAQT
jgi:8-oxo-dGTP diphosphatase